MRPSVLVVEDYADLRSAIVAALARRQYDCDHVTSADDAIAMLETHHYSAILLAPRLPIKDDPVMHFLVEHQPGELRKVILMTTPDITDEQTANDGDVLVKPFNNEQLFAQLAGRVTN